MSNRWLAENIPESDLSAEQAKLLSTLRAYLRHCQRRLNAGEITGESIDRRCGKIEEATLILWDMTRSRKR